jgi:hypothetical protein
MYIREALITINPAGKDYKTGPTYQASRYLLETQIKQDKKGKERP